MFRITDDPSSGSLVQCLGKNYKNDSIVSVDMDKVGVMAAYCDPLCVCVVHCVWRHSRVPSYTCLRINGHDRIIFVVFDQTLYKASLWWIHCDPKHIGELLNIYNFNCIYILYIVH